MFEVDSPLPQFFDTDGSPLDQGYLYFGQPNLNPETNPIQVYWDEAGTQPAPQPLRTLNGYISRFGIAAQVFVASAYSLTVRNKSGGLVIYSQDQKSLEDSLSGPTGSAQIGFLQAGVGAVLQTAQTKMRKFLHATDFGPIDTTGVTLATAVLQLALNAGAALKQPVILPPGIIASGALTWPVGLPGLCGQGSNATTLKAAGTIANFTPLISMSGVTGFSIHDLTIDLDQTVYLNHWNIQMLNCVDGRVEHVNFPRSGSAALRGTGCQDVTVRKCKIANFRDIGISYADGSPTNERITIDDCSVFATGTQSSHNISIVGGGGHTIQNCSTTNNRAGAFGASMYKCAGSHIKDNTFSECVAEGCNMQDCSSSTISGNTVLCAANSGDMGISLFGDPSVGGVCTDIIVSGNTIINPGGSGIGFAASVNRCLAVGNHIFNANQLNVTDYAGVLFYGLGCNSNAAIGNFIYDNSAKTRFGTSEWNDGTGSPLANTFIDNVTVGNGLTAEWNLLSSASRVRPGGWKPYSPSISSTGGALSGSTINSAEFKPDVQGIAIRLDITITNNGTGSGGILVPLPSGFTAPTNGGALSGVEIGVSGAGIVGIANGSGVIFRKADGSYPGGTNARLVASGYYELA